MREVILTPPMRFLADLLHERAGQILSESRMWRIEAALGPILRAHGLGSLDALVQAIESDARGHLAVEAVDALLNNETSFFRDAHIFNMLAEDILPAAIERATAMGRKKALRIWCAGCSSGQEALSLAMLFRNHQDKWPDWKLEILATDVSHSAIDKARSGTITQMEVQRGLSISDMVRWMEPEGDGWRISSALRGMIDFRVDNLCDPKAPKGDFDIILCRNVLLYFDAERKQDLFTLLAQHSSPGGWLLLGAGETTIGLTTHFAASQTCRGVYERIEPA